MLENPKPYTLKAILHLMFEADSLKPTARSLPHDPRREAWYWGLGLDIATLHIRPMKLDKNTGDEKHRTGAEGSLGGLDP